MRRRVLLIRLGALGDVINTLPALSRLRQSDPAAFVGYAVEDRCASLLEGHPDLDAVVVFPRRRWQRMIRSPGGALLALREAREYLRRLRGFRFGIAVDFQGTLKGALHSWLSGARVRIGFSRGHCYELNHLFSNVHVTPPQPVHRVEKFASLLGPLGISPRPGPYRLPESEESRARILRYLRRRRLDGYVVIHPGTSGFAPEKRWPQERFGQLARGIAEAGCGVVVTWGPTERRLATEVCRLSGYRAVLGPRTESILDLAELIRRARVFVSADTGPMHLAAACGTPCVALFGPKDPTLYRPYGPRHIVLQGRGPDPMAAIAVEDVLECVKRLFCG